MTDFNQFAEEEDVALRYAATPGDLAGADVIVPPGTKNTIEDLRYLGRRVSPKPFVSMLLGGGGGRNMRRLPDAGAKRGRSRWGRVRRDCRRVWPAERDHAIADE